MSVSISGILLDPYGQPARFAEVKFITWQGANDVLTTSNSVFKTSEDGAYAFSVEFGTFTVQVRYNQSNGKFQTIKQKVIVNSTTAASTLGELLLFNEPLTPPEIAYVEQLVAEAEGYRDECLIYRNETVAAAESVDGVYGYETRALMEADLSPKDQSIAYVTNDAIATNNGTYRKDGATGAGSWVQASSDLASQAYQNVKIVADNATLATVHTDFKGGEITASGTSLSCSIPSGWRYRRVGTRADLPAFSGLIPNTHCLSYNYNLNSLASKPTASVDYISEIIVFSNLSGVGVSAFPDVQEQIDKGRGIKVIDFVYDPGSPPAVDYSTGVITFTAGNRLLVDGAYIDLPVGPAPAISNLNGLYYESISGVLSSGSVQDIYSTSTNLIAFDFPELRSPIPSLNTVLESQVQYSEVGFASDNESSVNYSDDGSSNITVTFQPGCRVIGGAQNLQFKDLPNTPILINNLESLVIDMISGAVSAEVIPSKYDKRYSYNNSKVVLISNFYGKLSSGIPKLQRNISGRFSAPVYVADGNPITVNSYNSATKEITFTFPVFRLGVDTGVKLFTTGLTVALPQLKAVWLDLVSDTFITNKSVNEYINDPTKMLIAYNVNGYVSSPVPGMQTSFDRALISSDEIDYSVTEVTVGAGETYTTITDCFASLGPSSSANLRYRVLVKDGIYNELGQNGFGLEWPDHFYVYGQNKNNVIIIGPESTTPGETFNYDVIHKVGNGLISNVTLQAYKNKYAVHADAGLDNYKFVMQSVITRHLGSDHPTNVYWDIGIGFRNSQSLTCVDVEMQGYGIRIHGGLDAASRNPSGLDGWELNLTGCKIHRLDAEDFLEYYKSKITMEGNTIDEVEIWVDPQWYDGGSGVPELNRGWKNIGNNSVFSGNEIGKILYRDAGTISTLGGKLLAQGVNKRCYNVGGTILEGQAVRRVADIAKVASPTIEQTHDRVDSWGAGGLLLGFAEEDLEATSLGLVQYSGEPMARVSTSSGAILFGDKLTLVFSGDVTKWTTGDDVYAYALDDLSAGAGGMLKVKV